MPARALISAASVFLLLLLAVHTSSKKQHTRKMDLKAVTMKYFEVWNAKDEAGIKALHAPKSTLQVRTHPSIEAGQPRCRRGRNDRKDGRVGALVTHSLDLSLLIVQDWDGQHGPTNTDVSTAIAGIWKAVPDIKITDVKARRTHARDRHDMPRHSLFARTLHPGVHQHDQHLRRKHQGRCGCIDDPRRL